MAKTDPKAAYLTGILDEFRLARAETQAESDDLVAEINKADVEGRVRAARAEITRRQEIDSAADAERDPKTWLS